MATNSKIDLQKNYISAIKCPRADLRITAPPPRTRWRQKRAKNDSSQVPRLYTRGSGNLTRQTLATGGKKTLATGGKKHVDEREKIDTDC